MKRIISALVVSSLLLAGQALAADGIVFDGGDVRIKKGSGGALVFQDGSRQTTAANGVSKLVHGTVSGSGSWTGTGFSVDRTDIGTYDITFSPAFSSTPDCVVSAAGHLVNDYTQYGYVACEVTAISEHEVVVECRNYRPLNSTPTPIDDIFTFICVK
jgi:hypothetical protein